MRSRATCTLNDKRRPLSTVQCEKWPHVTDETIRRAPTTPRYDNIAKSFRERARIALAHAFADGKVLFAQVASRAGEITISELKSAFEWPGIKYRRDTMWRPVDITSAQIARFPAISLPLCRVAVAGRN